MNESNNSTFLSSIVFVLLTIVTALTVGFMAGIVGTFVYPVIIFPILIGILGGRMVTDNVKLTKMRNPSLIKWVTMAAAVIVFGTIFYARYLGLYIVTALPFGDLSDENLKVAKAIVDYTLEEETGRTGFIGYILFRASQGVSMGRMFSGNRLHLGPIFTWLYWLVELGVIAFIMAFTSKEISKQPFCENCKAWYGGKKHIGGVPAAREMEILNSIKLHEYVAVGKSLEENADMPSLEFYVQSCKTCEKSSSFLTVSKTAMQKGKLVSSDLLNATLTPHENKLLLDQLRPLEGYEKK